MSKVPPAVCWCDLLQTAGLVPLSFLKDSSESIRLHLESPKGGGWAEKKQSCTQLSFRKRRSCAEGEGRNAASASSLSAQKNAGQDTSPTPLPNCQTLAQPRSSQDTCLLDRALSGPRTSWNPRLPLPEKPVSEEAPASPTRAAATRALGSCTQRPELHSSAQTALRQGESQMAQRGCELAAVCHQELLRMPQSGEALGVTTLRQQRAVTSPCSSKPPSTKSPARCAQPSKRGSWRHKITGKDGRGRRKERRGEEGRNFFGKRLGLSFLLLFSTYLSISWSPNLYQCGCYQPKWQENHHESSSLFNYWANQVPRANPPKISFF